jgi:hypothetical protein
MTMRSVRRTEEGEYHGRQNNLVWPELNKRILTKLYAIAPPDVDFSRSNATLPCAGMFRRTAQCDLDPGEGDRAVAEWTTMCCFPTVPARTMVTIQQD